MRLQSSSSSFARPVQPAGDGYASARALEQALGCPFDADSAIPFEAVVRADEDESSPDWAFAALSELGAHQSLVPAADGGRLDSFDDLLMFTRLLARRDLVLPVGLGSTFLATIPIWLWGDAEQRARAAEIVTDGGFATLGITEESAGSDLVATRTEATRVDSGFRLDGEKWLVGNAGRAEFYVVLARAEPSFGLFLVDPDRVERGAVHKLPKVCTVGLRGHDLSGMALRGCLVPADATVGRVGRGLEMVSATLQYTRTLVAGMCLGSADRTAYRTALGADTSPLRGTDTRASTGAAAARGGLRGLADLRVRGHTGRARTQRGSPPDEPVVAGREVPRAVPVRAGRAGLRRGTGRPELLS